jgi:hypothetical protein
MTRWLSFVLLLVGFVCLGDEPSSEVEWVDYIAETELGLDTESHVEVRLFDDKRVDLVVNGYAIEVDWSRKWTEGVGQSLYYATVTDKKAGLLLLVKNSSTERKYLYQALAVCRKNQPPISLWAYDVQNKKFLAIGNPEGDLK